MKTLSLILLSLTLAACQPSDLTNAANKSAVDAGNDGHPMMANQLTFCVSAAQFTCSAAETDERGVEWMHCEPTSNSVDIAGYIQQKDTDDTIGWFFVAKIAKDLPRLQMADAYYDPRLTPFKDLGADQQKRLWILNSDTSLVTLGGACEQ